jgi:hypothetical protein
MKSRTREKLRHFLYDLTLIALGCALCAIAEPLTGLPVAVLVACLWAFSVLTR